MFQLRRLLSTLGCLLAASHAHAQLPDDSHWYYDYGGPSSEPFGVEIAGDYAYIFGGFLNVGGNIDMKNIVRFHLKRERFEEMPGIDRNFQNFVRDAYADHEGNIFFCGDFSTVNGITAKRVARYHIATQTWHALEDVTLPDGDRYGPSGGGAYAVIRVGNYVYLGGFLFDSPSNVGLRFVRRFNLNTERWEQVGPGLNDTVRAFAVDSTGRLYAGGSFTATGDGGTAMANVAAWNGTSWQAVQGGVNGDVRALDVDSMDRLAVGGQFTAAGSGGGAIACNDVAIWQLGAGWNGLDGGVTGGGNVHGIYGLSFGGQDVLYIGGDFDFDATGTRSLNKVAYFSGGQWNAMGSGLGRSSSQIVNGVDALGDDIFFTGVFARGWTSPNSQPNWARWNANIDFEGYIVGMPWVNCTTEFRVHPTTPDSYLLSHGSNTGQRYVVQFNGTMTGDWVTISSPFTATSDAGVNWTIPFGPGPRFYRILGLP
ncbi:MAG: hypothetical protein R3F11_05380 [Verrucomicrobiales bacterium]